jgi:hypothetical protein
MCLGVNLVSGLMACGSFDTDGYVNLAVFLA